ncbi:hypothetical protein [Macrococcus bovicus]|uniref:hypothetical protein n=1 Tax=Macrococcus bovicus TaxID=69968 RepID=UPI0025A66ABC|nr:hypothetical protein [Macrococcus bovicus]WJP96741.1 hypothetical protein QSV55_00070 [Macrococcus bovicus]
MLDQCLVIDVTEDKNELLVFSPLLDEEIKVQADDVVMNIVEESDEQIFLTVDIETKKVVEEE